MRNFLIILLNILNTEWYASNHAAEAKKIAGNGRFGTDSFNPGFDDQLDINPLIEPIQVSLSTI